MQTTIYYKEQDEYLLEKVKRKADRERRSKSAVILSILEEYFEANKDLTEILKDLGAISEQELAEALSRLEEEGGEIEFGRFLKAKGYVEEEQLQRARAIQENKGGS